jgi:hypothetical protein
MSLILLIDFLFLFFSFYLAASSLLAARDRFKVVLDEVAALISESDEGRLAFDVLADV